MTVPSAGGGARPATAPDGVLDQVAEKFACSARAGIYEVLEAVLVQDGVGTDTKQLLHRLDPVVQQASIHVRDAFFAILTTRVLPAARSVLNAAQSISSPQPLQLSATAPSVPLATTVSEAEHMIEACLPHGLLDQGSGQLNMLTEAEMLSAAQQPALPPAAARSSRSSLDYMEQGTLEHTNRPPAPTPHTATASHLQPQGLPPRSRTISTPGVNPSLAALLSAHASNGGDAADDVSSPAQRTQLGANSTPSPPRPAPTASEVASVPTTVASSLTTSMAGSQGPSSRAPSPSIVTSAVPVVVAHSVGSPPSPAPVASPPSPALAASPPSPAMLPPQHHQRPQRPAPVPPVVANGFRGSFDGAYHPFGTPSDGLGLGGLGGLGSLSQRPASFSGHPISGGPGFQRQPQLSQLSFQQQLHELQKEHANRNSGTSSPMPLPQQQQQQPPQHHQQALSESLLASLLALDSQAHGSCQLSSPLLRRSANANAANNGNAGNVLPGFDAERFAGLLAGNDCRDYFSADSTPDSCLSRSESYSMPRPPFVPPAASPLAPPTPAAAVAAAGRALQAQQQHQQAQQHAALQAQLQALHLQQQLQHQQHLLQPSQQLQLHQLQQLQQHQQAAAAAAAAFNNAALSSGDHLGSYGGDQLNGFGGTDHLGNFTATDHLGNFAGDHLGGFGSSGGLPPKAVEMPKRLKVLPVPVQNKILEVVTKLPVLQLKDFDDKVVYKLGLLLEQFGPGECINMLGHLMERIKKKDKSMMRNGPGYLDVAVSTHIDEMKALEKGAGTYNMPLDEYARQVLPAQLYEELREALEANRWLRWEDLDQGIVNVLKKMPRESALEKLQELTYHSFKNVDNTKGCIMSILNGRGDKGRRSMLGAV